MARTPLQERRCASVRSIVSRPRFGLEAVADQRGSAADARERKWRHHAGAAPGYAGTPGRYRNLPERGKAAELPRLAGTVALLLLVHQRVGALHQLLDRAGLLRVVRRGADGERQLVGAPGARVVRRDRLNESDEDALSVDRVLAREQNAELVAADARHDVGVPERLRE